MKKLLFLLVIAAQGFANYNLYERNLRDKHCNPRECRGYPNFNYNSPTYYPPPIAEAEEPEIEESEEIADDW